MVTLTLSAIRREEAEERGRKEVLTKMRDFVEQNGDEFSREELIDFINRTQSQSGEEKN